MNGPARRPTDGVTDPTRGADMTPDLPDLDFHIAAIEKAIDESPAQRLSGILGWMESAKAKCWTRLMTPGISGGLAHAAHEEPPKLLTPDEAAAIAQKPRKWIYRHTRGKRFRRDITRKCIRFEEAGLRRWLGPQK